MARQGPNVQGIVADASLLAWLRRFVRTKEEIEKIYLQAASARAERLTEVVITSGNLEGGGAAGQIAGDPAEMMAACEVALQELEAEGTCGVRPSRSNTTYFDFSNRRVGT